jgi:hypothetical protein
MPKVLSPGVRFLRPLHWSAHTGFLLPPIYFHCLRFPAACAHLGLHRFLLARWEVSSFPLPNLSSRAFLAFPACQCFVSRAWPHYGRHRSSLELAGYFFGLCSRISFFYLCYHQGFAFIPPRVELVHSVFALSVGRLPFVDFVVPEFVMVLVGGNRSCS